jgi:hypothetical protein
MSFTAHFVVIARLDRATQYTPPFSRLHERCRLLDHPVQPGDDNVRFDLRPHHPLNPASL